MKNADLERIFEAYLDDESGLLLDAVLATEMSLGLRAMREQVWFRHACVQHRDIELLLDFFGCLDAPA